MTITELTYYDNRFREGRFLTLFRLVHKGKISVQEAAEEAEKSEAEFSAAYKEWCANLESTNE